MVLEVLCFRNARRPGKFHLRDLTVSQQKNNNGSTLQDLSDGKLSSSQFPEKCFKKSTEIQFYITCRHGRTSPYSLNPPVKWISSETHGHHLFIKRKLRQIIGSSRAHPDLHFTSPLFGGDPFVQLVKMKDQYKIEKCMSFPPCILQVSQIFI